MSRSRGNDFTLDRFFTRLRSQTPLSTFRKKKDNHRIKKGFTRVSSMISIYVKIRKKKLKASCNFFPIFRDLVSIFLRFFGLLGSSNKCLYKNKSLGVCWSALKFGWRKIGGRWVSLRELSENGDDD